MPFGPISPPIFPVLECCRFLAPSRRLRPPRAAHRSPGWRGSFRMEETMFRFCLVIAAAAIVCPEVGATAEREMPKFDIAAACRGSGAVETVAKCTQDEQAARDQLARLWPQFRQSDASRCVQIVTPGGASGYVHSCW